MRFSFHPEFRGVAQLGNSHPTAERLLPPVDANALRAKAFLELAAW
jgi:hypothetical protein